MQEDPLTSRNDRLFQILSALIVVLMFALSLWAYPKLPARVPSHWNAAGEVNGYSTPFVGAFLLPAITVGVWLLFWLIPRIDPRKANYLLMNRVFWLISFVIVLFLGLLHSVTLLVALGLLRTGIVPVLIPAGIGLLFIVTGNYMGKVKFNYFFGIRTPWTLANEEVWYKTHRAVGPVWVIGGLIFLFSGFLPKQFAFPLILVVTLVLALGSIVYSYVLYQRVARR
ncbi:immunity protein SdpI [Peptococcaceae bacterium CEB3]|nr:immunity protein SdpI [Peptococcaceae bacterium CEB3]